MQNCSLRSFLKYYFKFFFIKNSRFHDTVHNNSGKSPSGINFCFCLNFKLHVKNVSKWKKLDFLSHFFRSKSKRIISTFVADLWIPGCFAKIRLLSNIIKNLWLTFKNFSICSLTHYIFAIVINRGKDALRHMSGRQPHLFFSFFRIIFLNK